jgi:tetratricopeptide (TPR) repeat protein
VARRADSRQATETLHEIESVFDRASAWMAANPVPVLAVLGGVLLIAAVVGVTRYLGQRSAHEGSAAVAAVQTSYLEAMGAQPGAIDVPEPANPETARSVRLEHAERFLEVAADHEGTAAAVEARVEAADLLEQVGEEERAREVWREAVREAPAGTVLRGLALQRYAAALERAGSLEEAATAFDEAGDIQAFPGRWLALAQAARLWSEAGRPQDAVAIADRLHEEAPPGTIPPHLQARLQTLRAAAGR